MTRTILITGVAGFIGSSTALELLKNGTKVIGIDNFDPFYPRTIKEQNLSELKEFESFSFIEHDILKIDQLHLNEQIDCIIHFAAKAGVRPSIESPQEYIEVNIRGTQAIISYCVANNIKKLIFSSSSSVYGNSNIVPFTETQRTDLPISPYAASKQAGELFCKVAAHLYQIDIICLRFFTVYGPKQRPDLAIHKFFKQIYQGKQIDIYGDNSIARDYTYIDDTVNGIVLSLNYILNNINVFEIINIGNEHPVGLLDLVNAIQKVVTVPVIINKKVQQQGDVDITFSDISKAKKLLGYQPRISFEDGLAKFSSWYQKKGN